MKVQRTIHLKLEIVSHGTGVLSLTDDKGVELESETVFFGGNSCADLGNNVKALAQRAEYLYG